MKVNDLMSTDAIEILQKIVDAYKKPREKTAILQCFFDTCIEVNRILDDAGLLEETDGDET